jgi:hypothetical protein
LLRVKGTLLLLGQDHAAWKHLVAEVRPLLPSEISRRLKVVRLVVAALTAARVLRHPV